MQRCNLHRYNSTIFVVYAKRLSITSKLKACGSQYCSESFVMNIASEMCN